MIVIEGKQGKSRKLDNLLRKEFMTTNVMILETKGIKALSLIEGVEHFILESDFTTDQAIDVFKSFSATKFNKYDWIVFLVDAALEEIEKFKEIDRQYSQNFIVTMNNENRGITGVYFL